ncbi:two-component system, NarL family, response regulator YdfI [Paenibacillus sp. UNCCL117]|uniref:response regulator n=1 Tax=unclassified Paenibacillus TaxID=185978 RepID=UPI0008840EEB|nr:MULTISPECIES: response regulator transcription factor [unclassified Paenibacillus]SDD72815.1 two component transcriptional regulator, LuxR family [Paenibacillus sp. cl123]SFW45788.1 two-component system, NarL family, response regulator YdfI [Paenibacillus sp. UNCCL117]
MKCKVLVVDDHLVVREGLKLILETDDDYEVIGEAGDGQAALELIEELQPDIVLMDINMPRMSGLEAIRVLKERACEIPVVILTTYNEDELMIQGLSLGAKGFLLKDSSRDNLMNTIQAAVRGETLLQPEISARIFALKKTTSAPTRQEKPVLSEKELIVLQAVARGYRSKEIAFDMGLSERTVKAHLTSIYNKLGVDSRSEAVAVSVERGILHL